MNCNRVMKILIEEEFLNNELSLKLKQLGFDDPCIAYHDPLESGIQFLDYPLTLWESRIVMAPTWLQAFRWLSDGIPESIIILSTRIEDNHDQIRKLIKYYKKVNSVKD